MIELGMNIDHVATLRQARRGQEPDPVWAAVEAELGGADLITMHLREDRRHVQDHDVERVKTVCHVKLNLEMAATDAMVELACRIRPHMATLVPEGRQEVTTEGGLNVADDPARLGDVVARLKAAGLAVSAFIDADPCQVDAAASVGFDMCEVHTGPYAAAFAQATMRRNEDGLRQELDRIGRAGRQVIEAGMWFNAGHALNYVNVKPIAALPGVEQLHIGHAVVARALFTGMRQAVAEMKRLMVEAAAGH